MSSDCISTGPIMPWCCVSMKGSAQIQALDRTTALVADAAVLAKPRATRTYLSPPRDNLAVCGDLDAQSGQVIGRKRGLPPPSGD